MTTLRVTRKFWCHFSDRHERNEFIVQATLIKSQSQGKSKVEMSARVNKHTSWLCQTVK